MINQQEVLNGWVEKRIKEFPHIEQVVKDAIENKEVFVDEKGMINMHGDYIKKVVPMTWFTTDLWNSMSKEEIESRIQEIKNELKRLNS